MSESLGEQLFYAENLRWLLQTIESDLHVFEGITADVVTFYFCFFSFSKAIQKN